MTPGQERSLLAGTVVLALAGLGGVQARGLWSLATDDTALPMAASAMGADPGQVLAAPDLSAILDFAPFGRADGGLPVVQSSSVAPADLTLLGIALADDPAASRAIIAGPDGVAVSHATGQRVPGGGVLDSVAADHVMIRAGDTVLTLAFPETGPAGLSREDAAPAGNAPDLMNLIPVAATAQDVPASLAVLSAVRDGLNGDHPGYVAAQGLEPASPGYHVLPGAGPALQRAGLRPGDLVRQVNQIAPGDPDSDLAILDAVAAAGLAVLTVQRGAQTITLTVPLE